MNQINLYDIGKAFHQRAHRDPKDPAKEKAHDLSRELWHSKKSKKELLAIIAKIKAIERTFRGIRVFYADVAEKAVRSGNYTVSIPHEIAHRYNERPGRVYILTSSLRPGQCKLGATTMGMFDRCYAYERKYGYRVSDFFSLETRTPFALEKSVADEIINFRVSGNAHGDSIEWYRFDPESLAGLIISMDHKMSLSCTSERPTSKSRI